MEKIFSPNRWFVLFCALLVAVWLGLQAVVNLRVADEAKLVGQRIFTWSWPGRHWASRAEITAAEVLRRSGTDAIVKIKGRQVLTRPHAADGGDAAMSSVTTDVSATLTFYKASNNWVLGKVEL